MMTRLLVLLLTLLCALPVLAAPGTADVFTADYSSADGNWDQTNTNASYHSSSIVVGGGPHGLNAWQTAYVPTGTNDQFYLGHNETLSNFSAGTSRFYRWFEYHESANDYYPADGGADFVIKRLVVGSGGTNRFILNIDSVPDTNPHIEVIFDSYPGVESSSTFSKGAWHSIQVEVVFGASSLIKVWLDTDTYASPTIVLDDGATYSSAFSGDTQFGNYSNDTLLTGHTVTFRDSAFRVATTFDSNWHGWLQNGDGPTGSSTGITGTSRFSGTVRIQ